MTFATPDKVDKWRKKQESTAKKKNRISRYKAVGYSKYVESSPTFYNKRIIEDEDAMQTWFWERRRPNYTEVRPSTRGRNHSHLDSYNRYTRYTRYTRYSKYSRYTRYTRYTQYAQYSKYSKYSKYSRAYSRKYHKAYSKGYRRQYLVGPRKYYRIKDYERRKYGRRPNQYLVGPRRYEKIPSGDRYNPSYYRTPSGSEYRPSYYRIPSYYRVSYDSYTQIGSPSVHHTEQWRRNLDNYNKKKDPDRPQNYFWAGEKFMLSISYTTSSPGEYNPSKMIQKAEIVGTSFAQTVFSTHVNGSKVTQTGAIWHKDMIKKWGSGGAHPITIKFTFKDGSTKSVHVVVDSSIDYYRLHRG